MGVLISHLNIAPINLAKLETQNYFDAARAQSEGSVVFWNVGNDGMRNE
jgi:hypothetical protein